MRCRVRVCLGLALAVLLSDALRANLDAPTTSGRSTRPFRLDDLFDEEELRNPTFSPDGRAIAFTRRRPISSQSTNGLLIAQTREDVWVQMSPGEPATNLTNGAADSSGSWDPQWSPDGHYLSFLSSRGGIVKAWVWDRSANKAQVLATQDIEFSGKAFAGKGSSGCHWIGARHLLCLAMPEGRPATAMAREGRAVERANAEWTRIARGEVSAAVVNSLEFPLPERPLILIDLHGGSTRTLGTVALLPYAASVWVAPDSKAIAFVESHVAQYPFTYRLRMGSPAAVRLFRWDGAAITLDRSLPNNVLTATLAWSPDSKYLAFFALDKAAINPVLLYGDEAAKDVRHERPASLEQPARLWRVSVEDGGVVAMDTGDVDLGRELRPPSFLWTASNELLFRTPRLALRATPHVDAKPDWLVLDRHGRTRSLLARRAPLPASLESIEAGAGFLGLMDGEVWRIDPQRGTLRNLTGSLAQPVYSLNIADAIGRGMTTSLKLGLPANADEQMILKFGISMAVKGVSDVLLDPGTGQITPLKLPDPASVLQTVHAATGTVAYWADDHRGTYLWRGDVSGHHEQLAAVNAYRSEIAKPEQRIIHFKTLNGEDATAYVTLPVGYVSGRRYPVVVDSDIGAEPNMVSMLDNNNTALPFASAGYVYMFAGSPVKSMDVVGRNNLLLATNGLLPAVDAAVESGFADPDRVFLFGQSSFGLGALGVITQTTRFRAAVATHGWSDQISRSLSISFIERYGDTPFDYMTFGAPYSYLKLPSWRNAEHYRRNSPLSYVDRVQTPVLIIQGDLDVIPIENAEMFFAALVLQRKIAQFVRYSGEGHGNRTPSNRRDELQRTLAWFDNHGDIARDDAGAMVFDGDRVKSRHGGPPLSPETFARIAPITSTARGSRTASPQEP